MASRDFDPSRLDVAAFAAAAGELEGELPAAAMPRLMAATLATPTEAPRAHVRWRALGGRQLLPGAGVRPSLAVEASTDVTLECQRCLLPMRVALDAARRIFFVEGEQAAAALDTETEDDVLALTTTLDLPALIEDELLLALPLVPRHEVCLEPLPRAFVDDDPAVASADNPFAALAALKQSSRPN